MSADHGVVPAQARLMADIARAFYLHGRSKTDIARQFSLTRFQIAKMLDDARALGIVTIDIRDDSRRSTTREELLSERLRIARVVIVDTSAGDRAEDGGSGLGIAMMRVLEELVRPGMTVGVSWSRNLDLAARFMPALPPCEIVQLAGALQLPGSGTLPRIIARLGTGPGTTTMPLYAPLVVDEVATAVDLRRQPEIAHALDRASDLDIAVVAIGSWQSGESTVWEKVSPADRDEARAKGAVAEISARLIDSRGDPVRTGLDRRVIGVTIDQLRAARQLVAVARGARRASAVMAAAAADLVTCLVIDDELAEALLQGDRERRSDEPDENRDENEEDPA